jgi:hypothetical protein
MILVVIHCPEYLSNVKSPQNAFLLKGLGGEIFQRILPIHSHVRGPLSFCVTSYDSWESTILFRITVEAAESR